MEVDEPTETKEPRGFLHLLEETPAPLWEDVQELSEVQYEFLHQKLEQQVSA